MYSMCKLAFINLFKKAKNEKEPSVVLPEMTCTSGDNKLHEMEKRLPRHNLGRRATLLILELLSVI